MEPSLDEFGHQVIKRVRDDAIFFTLREEAFTEAATSEVGGAPVAERLVRAAVDTALHYFLWLIESDESLKLEVVAEEGSGFDVVAASDGLSGELYTEDGWISRFSRYPGYDQ